MLGLSFVVGGTQTIEFAFSSVIAQTMSSFMFVGTGALILPAAFEAGLPGNASTQAGVLALSRGTSVVMLVIYLLFLVYQLKTHPHIFETEGLYGRGEDSAEAQFAPWASVSTLFIVTITVSICSDYIVGSIDGVVESLGISKTFIGLVLVPLVGNAGICSVDMSNRQWKP